MQSSPPITRNAGTDRHRRKHHRWGSPQARRCSAAGDSQCTAVGCYRLVIGGGGRNPQRARSAKVALTEEDRTAILALITEAAVWVEPTLKVDDCRDVKDDKYLELAATAGAEVIISSDDDLLALDPWHGTRIVRPAEFLGMR